MKTLYDFKVAIEELMDKALNYLSPEQIKMVIFVLIVYLILYLILASFYDDWFFFK